MASASACAFGILFTHIGASVQFSSTVRCGNRLNCWNTMPTFAPHRLDLPDLLGQLDALDDDLALLCRSSPLMQRIKRRLARARRPANHHALALRDGRG